MSSGNTKPLVALASDLADLGYYTIPINTGSGKPLIKWKDKLPFSDSEVSSWEHKFPSASLALITGYNGVAALDVDITWTKVANLIYRKVLKQWPNILIRQCNKPKFALVFAVGDSLLDYQNGRSDVWGTSEQDKQQIEYAGWNNQITVLGQHRKTGNKYRWGKNYTLLNTDIEDLPVLEFTDVEQIMGWFNQACERESNRSPHWQNQLLGKQRFTTKTSVSNTTPEESDGYFEDVKQVYTQEQIDNFLRHTDGTLRDEWMKVGWALHNHYKGDVHGLNKWLTWSQRFDSFEDGACEEQWSHMRNDREQVFTMHGLKQEAKKTLEQKKRTAMEEAIDRYVFIQRNSFVGDLEAPPNVQPYRLTDMKNGKKNEQITYLKATGNEGSQELLQAWLEHPGRQTLEDMNYFPSRERIIADKTTQQKYWNTYVPPFCETVRVPNEGLVKVFTDHIQYLFETQDDYNWIMDWMAHMVQSPYERPTVTPLHINKHTRTGRGWLTKILESLVGKTNTSSTDINKMVDSHAKNGYLADTVLVFVNEAKQDQGNKYGISDSLKTILTETRQNVDIKYGAQEDREIFSRFFIQSQHTDAIVLDEDGASRFQIFISNRKPRNEQYYDRLYSVLNNKEFINSVYTMLNRRTINRGWLFRSTMTEAKRILVAASQSPTSQAFFAFKKCIGSLPFPENLLTNFVNDYVNILFGEDMIQMNSAELLHLKKKHLPLRKINRDGELAIIIRSFNRNTDTSDLKQSLAMVQEKINKESIYA